VKRDKLATAVWVRLARAYGLTLREIRRRMTHLDLTLPQFDVVAQLARDSDGMTAGDLSRAMLVTAGNVTGIIARLSARGIVERTRDPNDARVVRLRLSPAGRRIALREIAKEEHQLGEIFARLNPATFQRVIDALDTLRHAVDDSDASEDVK